MTEMGEYRNLTRNILRIYRSAPPTLVAVGRAWYDSAYTECERLAWRNGHRVEAAAAAMSHLSPRITWRQNMDFLDALLAGREKPNGCLSRSWAAAQRALVAEEPLATFSKEALKTGNFARAIVGDRQAIVVDVWSARAAGVGESMIRSSRGYHTVAEAYRRGARRVGESPRDLQAITWCVVRGAAA